MRNPFRRRPAPPRISDHAHTYIRELMTADPGTPERMVGDLADLVGDEYLLETMGQITRIYRYGSTVHKVAARIARQAVRP